MGLVRFDSLSEWAYDGDVGILLNVVKADKVII